jgi:two-component system chemotaxis response regulator CheB
MAGRDDSDKRVIGLVGSAGGLDAVRRILRRLPPNLDAAVIVLLHADPEGPSHLVEIIRRECALPVVEAHDGERLLPGRVVVAPPGKHLLIVADDPMPRTALIGSGAFPPSRPSADLLLATLATAVGRRAIAVILSGGGHDGATGATAVHVLGGTVLATDETSSAHFSMPLAAIERDAAVDRVLPLDQIAEAVQELVDDGRSAVALE